MFAGSAAIDVVEVVPLELPDVPADDVDPGPVGVLELPAGELPGDVVAGGEVDGAGVPAAAMTLADTALPITRSAARCTA